MFIIVIDYNQECIRKSVQQTHIVVIVNTSVSGFDVTAVAVVGRDYG